MTHTGSSIKKMDPVHIRGTKVLYVGGYFPFSYLENVSIKVARSLGVRAAGGKPKWSL